jgi:diguanylate cyclase (GGDEF)-like protein
LTLAENTSQPAEEAEPRIDPTARTQSGRQFGIAAHLGLACAAVACLAWAANSLVREGTLIVRTIEVPTTAAPQESPPPVTPAVPVDARALLASLESYRRATLDRAASAARASDRAMQEAGEQLGREAKAYASRAGAALSTRDGRRLREDLERHTRQGAEFVRLADARAALLEVCWSRFAELDRERLAALERSPNLFGRTRVRESLLEIEQQLAEIRRYLAKLATPTDYTDADLAALNAHEAALLAALDEATRSAASARQREWSGQARDLAYQFMAARESLLDTDRERQRAAQAFQSSGSALATLAGKQRLRTPDATAATTAPVVPVLPVAPAAAEPRTVSMTSTPLDAPWKRRLLAWLSAGVLLLFLGLSLLMVVRVVGPVRQLMQASRRIADGDTSQRVARGGIKELDALAGTFNQMAERLATAQQVAREYQQRLEDTVEERTRQLLHLAAHDPLTELPNRRELFEHLSAAVQRAEQQGTLVGVFVLDIDNFKNLNDSVGHAYGDRVLQGVAHRLAEVTAPYGFSARLGGDEFTVVVERAAGPNAIQTAGESLVRAFQSPLEVDGRALVLSISVGAACYPTHGSDAEALLRAADAALFRAKALGRSQLHVYTPDLLAAAANRFSIEQGLRRALERDELELVYQPEVDVNSLEVGLAEALLRWRLPDGRLVAPAEFLAIAEESGLIMEISDWVLRTAIETAADWHRGAWPRARVAINVSARQVLDLGFEQRLLALLKRHRLPAHCVELELTENVLQTGRATVEAIRRLRGSGVGIALDDFGTGYSSLSSLEHLPLTRVKLDRSLIASIDENPRSLVIARAISGLCENLGLEMTAEGIERPEQLALLLDRRSIHLQGYLLSRPVTRQDLPARIREIPAQLQSMLLTSPALRRARDPASVEMSAIRRISGFATGA